jgi:hypothetical protein
VTCKGGTLPLHGWPNPYPVDRECQTVSPANGRFAIDYVSTVNPGNPAGSCNNAPGDSWQVTPNIRYRSIDGGLWTAWRSPLYLGTWNFLNIQQAQRQSGNAGIVEIPDPSEQGHNARQLAGSGTHWTADFHAGDNIMLVDPVNGQRNRIGGLVSVIRTVNAVIDDTTLNLNSSVECVSGTDGNDCVMFSTVGYNSFMNPADGVDGNGNGMIVNCTGPSCVSPQTYPFEIYKLTALNPGTTCGTWDPATDPHPPASGCYYSDSIQFQSQTYASDGESRWWNVSLPARGAHTPIANKANASTNALEPWLDQPAVTMQPESVLVSAGSNVSFTTAATGTPAPTVQWQQSADSGLTWNNIAGATNTTYSLNGVTQGQNGMGYRAVFTNANGSRITHSASLGINAAPQITLSPVSIPLAQPGDLVEFTSSASGAPEPAPMWQLSINGGVTWSDLGGATSKLSLIAPPSGPRLYVRVVYTNASGSATSQIAFVATDDVFNSGFEPPAGP